MPHINLPRRKKREKTFNQSAFQKYYNTPIWKKLRAAKIRNNPLCELCLKKNPPVIRQTEEIHHRVFIDIDNPDPVLIYDYDNLQSLCKECHANIHNNARNANNQRK